MPIHAPVGLPVGLPVEIETTFRSCSNRLPEIWLFIGYDEGLWHFTSSLALLDSSVRLLHARCWLKETGFAASTISRPANTKTSPRFLSASTSTKPLSSIWTQ